MDSNISLLGPIDIQRCVDSVTNLNVVLRGICETLEEGDSPLQDEAGDLLEQHETFLDRVLALEDKKQVDACMVEWRRLRTAVEALFARIGEEIEREDAVE